MSLEESLSYDAEGNELHLEDILGTEPDLITKELDILKDSLTSITIDEVLKVMGFDKDYYIV